MLRDEKILITGSTSQVGLPVARELARHNEVHGLARFAKVDDRRRMQEIGVRCHALDLAADSFDAVPDDFDVVLHFAVVKTGDWDFDLVANAGGTGRLMAHCRRARAFLHCSSAGVYAEDPSEPRAESSPLGDNHRVLLPTYSICKIAAEAVARFGATQWKLPTTIARLSVPYGDNGGWPWVHVMMMKSGVPIPVHVDAPSVYNPIHEDDIVEQIPRLLEIAAVPAEVINWGGAPVGLEEWCAHIASLTHLEPVLHPTADTLRGLPVDVTRMRELVGETRVDWRDGIRRMISARAPELLV
ncbi:MAG: NAD-dependent epimerase/dehydratase family protein [Myxococcota bacterium]